MQNTKRRDSVCLAVLASCCPLVFREPLSCKSHVKFLGDITDDVTQLFGPIAFDAFWCVLRAVPRRLRLLLVALASCHHQPPPPRNDEEQEVLEKEQETVVGAHLKDR